MLFRSKILRSSSSLHSRGVCALTSVSGAGIPYFSLSSVHLRLNSLTIGRIAGDLQSSKPGWETCAASRACSHKAKCADFRANFRRLQGKNLQAHWRASKIFNAADGKICRKDVCLALCEQAPAYLLHQIATA